LSSVTSSSHAVVGLGDPRGAERVGLDQVGARGEIRVVDLADHVGAREHEDLVVAAQVARVVAEALAAEVGLAELARLDHRAHRAIDHEDPLGEDPLECASGLGSAALRSSRLARAAELDKDQPISMS
jgi:hypothetical protein